MMRLRRGLFDVVINQGGGAAPVTYSISGVVYDADGTTPVAGATVALGALSAVSAANGTYTISNVPAGTSGSMTCTKGGFNWAAITIAAMSGNLIAQNYTANNYAAILKMVYGASEIYPLVDIASGTDIPAYVSAAHDGTLVGLDLQNTAGPVTGTLAPYFDGTNDYGNIGSEALIWGNGAVGGAIIYGKVSGVGDWTDGVERNLFKYQFNTNNLIRIFKQDTTIGIRAYIAIGGVAKIVTIGSPATIGEGWFCVGVTWKDSANGNEVKCYLNGSQVGATQTGFGVWGGVPTSLLLSAGSSTPANTWKGWLAYHAIKLGAIWTPTEMSNIYAARTTAGPDVAPIDFGGATISELTSGVVATEATRWFGRATMEILSNGNTILVYEEATAHSENHDDVIHIRFSDDNGATWTAENTDLNGNPVAGFPAYPDGGIADQYGPGGTYIWQAPNGDIWLHCWKVDYSPASMLGGWRMKSTDGGITWGAWEQFTVSGQTAGENLNSIFEEVHFVYGTDVYAIIRVYGATLWTDVKGVFIKSTDNGATWTKISDLSAYTNKTHEFAMEYLDNNNILVLARDSTNARTFRIASSDFGATWGPIIQIESSINVIGRNRMFTDAHIKGQANWWTDNRLIMCGFVLTNPGNSTGRRNAIWLSEDGGTSWTKPIYLDTAADDGGYGDLIYDANTDTYRVVTYKGDENAADLVQYNFKVNWTS